MKSSFTESDLWDQIKPVLMRDGHATRHEDRMSPGTPDVSYGLRLVSGWIELKAYPRTPSPFDVPPWRNLKPQQRRFLRKRHAAAGNCYIMASFGREILLISAQYVDDLGSADYGLLQTLSSGYWRGSVRTSDLIAILERPRPPVLPFVTEPDTRYNRTVQNGIRKRKCPAATTAERPSNKASEHVDSAATSAACTLGARRKRHPATTADLPLTLRITSRRDRTGLRSKGDSQN